MKRKEANILYRRLLRSYLSSVISISLVLFIVALAGLVVINAKSVSDYFKENIAVSVILKIETPESQAQLLANKLAKENFVKDVRYVSKEEGVKEMEELLGEGFLDVFESEPIPISLELQLESDYFSSDSLNVIEKKILCNKSVSEVLYQENLVDILNANLEKAAIVISIFILLLLFVSFVLINNTVRLNVYSKRFTIHTMRLVGATKGFITKPFVAQAAFQGLISSLLAVVGLLFTVYTIRNEFNQLFMIFDMMHLIVLVVSIIALGILICVISTNFVVRRVVSLTSDDLYY